MDMDAGALMIGEYRGFIERDFPDFKINEMKYLGSGWDNAAFLVNGEYVFRFLRGLFDRSHPLRTDEIKKEVNILNYLHGKVSFAVPKPDFIGQFYSYFGYKLVPGSLWDKVDQPFNDDYLKSWVAIRSEISKAIKPSDSQALMISTYQTAKNEQFVKTFLADDSADERVKNIARQAMNYVLSKCANTSSWVFIHEDLQMSNCIVDPAAKRITGVVDWLEAEIGPVEAEFYFWSKYGHETLEKVARLQQDHDGTVIDVALAVAIHQFYITADYIDFKNRGFTDAAAHKWSQIEAYL